MIDTSAAPTVSSAAPVFRNDARAGVVLLGVLTSAPSTSCEVPNRHKHEHRHEAKAEDRERNDHDLLAEDDDEQSQDREVRRDVPKPSRHVLSLWPARLGECPE